jgi:single-strand DNA-binding protein
MKGLNRAFFIGRIGHEPELRSTAAGMAVVRVSVGTPHARKVNGAWEEEMEWHRLVAFGQQGEFIAKYAHKGDPLATECYVRHNKWTDKEGKLHFDTSFVIDKILWLGRKNAVMADAPAAEASSETPPPPASTGNDGQEEIPF